MSFGWYGTVAKPTGILAATAVFRHLGETGRCNGVCPGATANVRVPDGDPSRLFRLSRLAS